MTTDFRKSMLAKIHVAKKQLGLTDDDYRDVIEAQTGERSASQLNNRQLDQLLRHFSGCGWQERSMRVRKNDAGAPTEKAMNSKALLSKIEALLAEIGSQEGKHVPWSYAAAILKRMYKVDKLEWAKPDQLRGVIAALHSKLAKLRDSTQVESAPSELNG
jgi:phage gp16-like protein